MTSELNPYAYAYINKDDHQYGGLFGTQPLTDDDIKAGYTQIPLYTRATPAPCDELETVAKTDAEELAMVDDGEFSSIWPPDVIGELPQIELVTRQNAEEVIAAKDARIKELESELKEALRGNRYAGLERIALNKNQALEADNKRLREALEWYAETAEGCRKIGSAGDAYRHALDHDGGNIAHAALEVKP